jgi:uncharacterized protein (TIGR04255 family)
MSTPLPEYERPPINEVVMGVQFEPLKNIHSAIFGRYWERIRDRYPRAQEHPPLLHTIEPIGIEPQPSQPQLILRSSPFQPRSWFLREDECVLIQVQQDRYHRNWRQVRGDEKYPRFPTLLKEFQKEWSDFLEFLSEQKIEEPKIDQAELAYINIIELPGGTRDFAQLPDVFPTLGVWKKGGILPPPELVNWGVRYLLPDGRGRLHIQMDPAFRQTDMKFILNLNLTARGAPAGSKTDDLIDWLNLAHEWVVKAFDELTGPKMHAEWGRRT